MYLDTDATITDDPDEDMIKIVEDIEKLVEDKLGIKLVVHLAELTDDNDDRLGVYET